MDKSMKVAGAVVGGLALLGIGVAIGRSNTTTKTVVRTVPGPIVTVTVAPTIAATSTPTTTAPTAPTASTVTFPDNAANHTISSDGVYLVGKEVAAGRYHTDGKPAGSAVCSAYTSKDGSSDTIVEIWPNPGPQYAQLNAGQYFSTQGCGTWTLTP